MLADVGGMTSAHLRILRESLGLGRMEFATLIGTRSKTVTNWEQGHSNIPPGAFRDALQLCEEMQHIVDAMVVEYKDQEQPVLRTYATDEAFRAANPGTRYPASWHRMIAARVLDRVPQLRITF